MGKTFDVEAFRQSAASYDERLREWAYEGNLSLFDMSQWVHEWFGEPEYGSLYHDYAANNGTIEAACEIRSKLVRADNTLWQIRDIDIYSGTCLMYEPLTGEYLDGMTHGAFASGNWEACREWCQYAAAVAFAAFTGELFL